MRWQIELYFVLTSPGITGYLEVSQTFLNKNRFVLWEAFENIGRAAMEFDAARLAGPRDEEVRQIVRGSSDCPGQAQLRHVVCEHAVDVIQLGIGHRFL